MGSPLFTNITVTKHDSQATISAIMNVFVKLVVPLIHYCLINKKVKIQIIPFKFGNSHLSFVFVIFIY